MSCISTAYMEGVFASPRQQCLLQRAIFWRNLLLPSSTQLKEVARTFTKVITIFLSQQNYKSPDNFHNHHKMYCKGKAVPLQAWSGPEGSRKLRFPDFVTTAQDGSRLSALRTGHLYPQEIFLVLISVRG